ncbi:MAG: selenocysteine-specific translation elongation factor [Acidobacteriota bacterium]|nr:selenocysteine-specific translation elongation factor [Acidobacteriota bacterium]
MASNRSQTSNPLPDTRPLTPGPQLAPDTSFSVIVGTAGHIDHGKSALVRALTGSDPDRLPEEKRRGITIDLGFADLDLDGVRIGFVDVPGHERFVKNMLAGVHGIDVVALVIAADEGVMPQTREHFDICRLLGVQRGLIVITKTDLVEEELLELVTSEVAELVAGSFLESAPIIPVSAKTGAGLDQLKAALKEVSLQVPARADGYLTRLPVDRVFAMKGFGAVVTGTLVSGTIKEGDELELLPIHSRVRARGVQVHGNSVAQARAGQRTALNLGGIDTNAIERGMLLAPVSSLRTTQILDAKVSMLPGAPRALRTRARVRFHIHAAEVLARIQVLESSGQVAPGAAGLVQLRLETPIATVAGEHFILRSYSPSVTIAGGEVLDPLASKHRGRDVADVRRSLAILAGDDPAAQLSVFIATSGDLGQRKEDLKARTGWEDERLFPSLKEAIDRGMIVDCSGLLLNQKKYAGLKAAALDEVGEHHRREPLSRGLARETLRERHFAHLPAEVFRAVLSELEAAGSLVSEKELVRTSAHVLELSTSDVALRDRINSVYELAGLEPPTLDEALQAAGVSPPQKTHARKLLQLLLDRGSLVRVQGDLYFHSRPLAELTATLKRFALAHPSDASLDVATFKELAGVSRKYAIPLLEFLDRERITRRVGDRRQLLN